MLDFLFESQPDMPDLKFDDSGHGGIS
jgi:hypothetical protein